MEKRRAAVLATCAIIISLLAFTGVAVHLSMVSNKNTKNTPTKNNPSENGHGGSPSGGTFESPQSSDGSNNQQTLVVVKPEPPKLPCKCPFKREQQHTHSSDSSDSNVFLVNDITNGQANAIPACSNLRKDHASIGVNELHARK
jgi:hypothetical protein